MSLSTFVIITLFISCVTNKIRTSNDSVILYSYQSQRGDAVFSKIVPNNNYGMLEDIHLYAWTQNGILNVNRVVLDFNTSEIPQNILLERAYLNLYFNPISKYDAALGGLGSSGTIGFMVERVESDWDEKTVTWATQPVVDLAKQVVLAKKSNPQTNYLKIDVTELVQDMINKPTDERFGLRLRLVTEEPYNVYFFASGNHPDVTLRPTLQIEFK